MTISMNNRQLIKKEGVTMYKVLFGTILFIATLTQAQAVTVNVVPDSGTVGLNDAFSVLVSGVGFAETGGGTLSLTFDPTVVSAPDL